MTFAPENRSRGDWSSSFRGVAIAMSFMCRMAWGHCLNTQHKCAKFNLWRQAARTPSLTCALQPRITPRVSKTESLHRYTSIGTILDPKLAAQDNKQAQTPDDPALGLLQNTCYDKVIMPKRETSNDLNESARVIQEYARKNNEVHHSFI